MGQEIKRIDVTSKVVGRYENGQMGLYMGKAKIGDVRETNQGFQHEMAAGFEFDQDKIYRHELENANEVESYANCENSWC